MLLTSSEQTIRFKQKRPIFFFLHDIFFSSGIKRKLSVSERPIETAIITVIITKQKRTR